MYLRGLGKFRETCTPLDPVLCPAPSAPQPGVPHNGDQRDPPNKENVGPRNLRSLLVTHHSAVLRHATDLPPEKDTPRVDGKLFLNNNDIPDRIAITCIPQPPPLRSVMKNDNFIAADPNLHYASHEPPEDWHSDTTSLASNVYNGFIENGRRYPDLNGRESHVPSDDQMFEAYEACHLVALTIDSHLDNPLFHAPVGRSVKNILDIGTGKDTWAIDVADTFSKVTVRGVDLFPPPVSWIPPNCILEVDNIMQEWTWRDPFDLIHLRILDSAFTPEETDCLYNQCYNSMTPSGWIEQFELSAIIECDDDTVPKDNILFSWGPRLNLAAEKAGRPLGIMRTMRQSLEKAGFTDIHVKDYKWPIGPWPRDKQLKEAGAVNFQHWSSGMEGYAMWLLTKFGDPVPWSKEEVQVYVAQMRKQLSTPGFHCYHRARRIWARKPPEDVIPTIETSP